MADSSSANENDDRRQGSTLPSSSIPPPSPPQPQPAVDETNDSSSQQLHAPASLNLPPPPLAFKSRRRLLKEQKEGWHPESKWQEPWADDGLTLYDIHREPLQLAEEARPTAAAATTNPSSSSSSSHNIVKCSLKSLDPEFQCVICLQYMDDPMIVMDCLHRFCGECIQKCLRFGNQKRECPTCRAPIPSRRSLRRDVKWNAVIQNVLLRHQKRQPSQQRPEQHDESQRVATTITAADDVDNTINSVHAKRRWSGDRRSNHHEPSVSLLSQSLNAPPPKRARNLQDAIVEKQNALKMQKRLRLQHKLQLKQASQQASQQANTIQNDPSLNMEASENATARAMTATTAADATSVDKDCPSTTPALLPVLFSPTQPLQTTQQLLNLPLSSSSSSPSLATIIQLHLEVSPLIDIHLVRHAEERSVQPLFRPYLTLRGAATISVLQHFLSSKLGRASADSFQISGAVNKKPVRFNPNMTLFQVREACLRLKRPRSSRAASAKVAAATTTTKPFVLHYRLATVSSRQPKVFTSATEAAALTATAGAPTLKAPPVARPPMKTSAASNNVQPAFPSATLRVADANSPSPKNAPVKNPSLTREQATTTTINPPAKSPLPQTVDHGIPLSSSPASTPDETTHAAVATIEGESTSAMMCERCEAFTETMSVTNSATRCPSPATAASTTTQNDSSARMHLEHDDPQPQSNATDGVTSTTDAVAAGNVTHGLTSPQPETAHHE